MPNKTIETLAIVRKTVEIECREQNDHRRLLVDEVRKRAAISFMIITRSSFDITTTQNTKTHLFESAFFLPMDGTHVLMRVVYTTNAQCFQELSEVIFAFRCFACADDVMNFKFDVLQQNKLFRNVS
jgi:hypothetical protein